MNKKILVSETGKLRGAGTSPYKWVSFLSPEERKHVRSGGLVFIRNNGAHHYTQSGWKIVVYGSGKYYHREPNESQITQFNKQFSLPEVT